MGEHPAVERHQNRCAHGDLHHISQDQEGAAQQLRGEARDKEVCGKGPPEHGENLQAQDEKAPEDHEMHPPRGLLANHKFLLAEGVHQHRFKALTDAVKAVDRPGGKQKPQAAREGMHKVSQGNKDDQGKKQKRHGSVPPPTVSWIIDRSG
ncbi:MAG: hypothetical protein HYZ72_15725 [Deltaproteobacteria bacterium]|nr:hypothetical protein [Deltaproteobacteria bacterium]